MAAAEEVLVQCVPRAAPLWHVTMQDIPIIPPPGK